MLHVNFNKSQNMQKNQDLLVFIILEILKLSSERLDRCQCRQTPYTNSVKLTSTFAESTEKNNIHHKHKKYDNTEKSLIWRGQVKVICPGFFSHVKNDNRYVLDNFQLLVDICLVCLYKTWSFVICNLELFFQQSPDIGIWISLDW